VIGSTTRRLRPSGGRAGYFFVTHPSEFRPLAPVKAKRSTTPRVAAAPKAPRATKTVERDYGVCDVCFMVKTPSGGCGCD
jgi:hypothetical protein